MARLTPDQIGIRAEGTLAVLRTRWHVSLQRVAVLERRDFSLLKGKTEVATTFALRHLQDMNIHTEGQAMASYDDLAKMLAGRVQERDRAERPARALEVAVA